MAQRRKKTSRKRGASRAGSSGLPAVAWFLAGLILGLAIAGVALFKGMLPAPPTAGPAQEVSVAPPPDGALINDSGAAVIESQGSRFDFFTVLPEMEVVVPEQELATGSSRESASATGDRTGAYILQAGSFRSLADADQLKARLALLGAQANIQEVSVNEVKWHRVRIGPVQGARQADELRRMLLDNNIETLVLKDSS
jgi:cell division protein FtsN